jgi:hypothetical protein
MSFLRQIGLETTDIEVEGLSEIEAMIKRRHLIVHRADKVDGEIQTIDSNLVLAWVSAAQSFMQNLVPPVVLKRHTPQYLEEKYNIKVTQT